MSEYKITCCSTVDLPASYFEEKNLPFVCYHFHMDGVDYPDDLGKSMAFDEFYKRISEGSEPTTAQVNVQQYTELFEPILKEGKDLLHLTLSSGITGSINSANIAKEQLEEKYPERKIFIMDSLAASSGYGMLFDEELENKEKG